jgi:integrase
MKKPIYPNFTNSGVKPLRRRTGITSNLIFYDFVESYLTDRAHILERGTLKGQWSRHRLLQQFAIDVLKKPALDFSDFNNQFPLKLQNWCYAPPREHSKNYVAKILDIIRTWLREASKTLGVSGLSEAWQSKSYRLEDAPIDNIALSFEEVSHLFSLDLSGQERLAHIRDIFVFDCLTGFRYCDVADLEKVNFKTIFENGTPLSIVDVVTIKTGERVNVPLHPMAKAIVERNGGTLPRVPSNQKLNDYLKELCAFADMTELIQLRKNVAGKLVVQTFAKYEAVSCHTARRTFATLAYVHFKMPSILVMKITGHKSEREFFKYIKIDRRAAAVEMAGYMRA